MPPDMTNPITFDGIVLTELAKHENEKGSVLHLMRNGDAGYAGFGEAYISTVAEGVIKGWRRHRTMTLNLAVPVGEIQIWVLREDTNDLIPPKIYTVRLSLRNYCRLSVQPGLWVAFGGMAPGQNILINIASHRHDKAEEDYLPHESGPIPLHWPRLGLNSL